MQKLIRNIFRSFMVPPKSTGAHEEGSFAKSQFYPRFEEGLSAEKTANQSEMALSFYSWLHMVAPAFPVNADKIRILNEPSEFYETLVNKCSNAHTRITFSSLYLGTGDLEKALVETIKKRLVDLQGQLKVTLLFDHCRGSRGAINSRSMVAPLLQEHPSSVQVSLYHTVALRGFLRFILPQRFNEVVGLQHMKLYIFDDSLIISGANLSHDYFTNRQDRYIVIEDCADLADFYANLIQQVSEFSFNLLPNGSTTLHPSWSQACHPFEGDKQMFIEEARQRVRKSFFSSMSKTDNAAVKKKADTWVFPLIQMGQLEIHHDSEVTLGLLERSPTGSHVYLATGYFNLPKMYMDTILEKSKATFTVLTAHPSTNGFLNANGVAGGIPALYTQLAKEFFNKACKLQQQDRVEIKEYIRPGWTYHGKGLWLTLPGQKFPSLSLVGSPNFGSRSIDRDLETQIAVVTSNPSLQKRLQEERDRLYEKGIVATKSTFSKEERLVPFWVLCVSRLFRRLF
ncbi:CDP-diacylglycerol--glycerol-3-phosphate 3-phosphatidyltransferase, mitochondrial isoform X3 [Frankliniella occidentalis]|uniref:CDP-diacylglycerol--glycerol-3-phosphate 3-phosphatidyltransferase n=1 Tax=Frankliniella occidentalis TaxID=133901 RepID=A0A6J1SDU5_FRAOC|nr:CDP-diacylglycerol--glycerol-3-phosphate 3-phosphatidyltransferase, mitochondrial isoform X3 [Frankliniella occidentalis]